MIAERLRLLRDTEVDALCTFFLEARDAFAAPEEGAPRPEVAALFNELLILLDDDRQRRTREHRDVMDIMTRGDRPRRTLGGWRGDANDPHPPAA